MMGRGITYSDLQKRIEELEDENERLREERLAFATHCEELQQQVEELQKNRERIIAKIIDCDRHKIAGTAIGPHSGFWIDPDELEAVIKRDSE